jgi:hypothetical protein
MVLGSKQKFTANGDCALKVVINNSNIERVDHAKSLGVTIGKNLNWSLHVKNVCKKVSSSIGALKRARPFVSEHTAEQIYKTLILPHFDYCSTVWGGIDQYLVDKLQKLQNRAARVITRTSYETRSTKLLSELNWDKLATRRHKQKATLMFKTRRGLAPNYLQTMFESKIKSHKLRNSENALLLPKLRTEYMKKAFCYSGARLWNALPSTARKAKSISQFRENIEGFFTDANTDTAYM